MLSDHLLVSWRIKVTANSANTDWKKPYAKSFVKNYKKSNMNIGGIEGTDKNGKRINKIGVWTDKGFVETPIEKLFPPLKKKKQSKS
jgi:hypothetical protein